MQCHVQDRRRRTYRAYLRGPIGRPNKNFGKDERMKTIEIRYYEFETKIFLQFEAV